MEARRSRKAADARKKPGVSKEALSSIDLQKSLIADMRPARRRIKWNKAVSDWDRKGDQTSTRIKVGIDLEELEFLGGVPLNQTTPTQNEATVSRQTTEEPYSSITDFSNVEADEVDQLEEKINRTYESIKRIAQENDGLDKDVDRLKQENQALREDIAAVPLGNNSTKKSVDQLHQLEKKLKAKLRELDHQCKLLRKRRTEIMQTKRRLASEDVHDDSKSYSTQASKSISSILDVDSEEDEEIVVFSNERSEKEDGDSETE